MRTPLKYLWAGPATLLGLVLASLVVPRGHAAMVDGVLEAHGPLIRRGLSRLIRGQGGAAAITFGHVVLGQSAQALEMTREHERAHVAQYEAWGPFFIPAYLVASGWALASGKHPYLDNHFEREARRAADISGVLRFPS